MEFVWEISQVAPTTLKAGHLSNKYLYVAVRLECLQTLSMLCVIYKMETIRMPTLQSNN